MVTDFKAEVVRILSQAWPNLNPALLPGGSPVGETLPDSLLEDIAEYYSQDHKRDIHFQHGEGLPLLARVPARGYWEDDWQAKPSATHPWPVILIHGTGSSPGNFEEMGAELRAEGWTVFAPAYGHRATDSLISSAAQVGAYIDTVLAATGAEKVILVGHSQGGLLIRWWMRFLGGAAYTKHVVTLSSPHHGTSKGGILSQVINTPRAEKFMDTLIFRIFGPAGPDQISGSAALEQLNAAGDTEAGISYTCLSTHFDSVVQPPESAFLRPTAPNSEVRNIWVGDLDPRALISHKQMSYDPQPRKIVCADLARFSQ
ncbi:esterase/lipase family protein [Corynebacterium caspium]|uniref:esterase/lipase family protein n=1 Tax=Corynebacterium caspium TaxID=234828 RepID=UPI000372381B|nr:triacylglycerol lipase [Corynebacterium caspium]WKD58493.1 Extracellular esterase EstB precursor [Corynebacterium caspium DSM 44850]